MNYVRGKRRIKNGNIFYDVSVHIREQRAWNTFWVLHFHGKEILLGGGAQVDNGTIGFDVTSLPNVFLLLNLKFSQHHIYK